MKGQSGKSKTVFFCVVFALLRTRFKKLTRPDSGRTLDAWHQRLLRNQPALYLGQAHLPFPTLPPATLRRFESMPKD
jgi:hypothetical protein